MKTLSALTAAMIAFLPATLLAEGHGDADWAEKAARGYEEKARWAEKEGMPRVAAIYLRMAEIKREAGRAAKSGKEFNWAEYHELEGKLNQLKEERRHEGKPEERKEQPGEGFVRAAEEYRRQARMAREHGDDDKAYIYNQLAEMKMAAATAAKEGREYDWTRYHELRKKLEGGREGGDKPHDKPKEDWGKPKHEEHHDKPAPAGKLNIE